uniref:Uncharacterized protein n=1 Tax=Manihot esculenta TaxID=3983 RepID=A0A199U920_MANES
MIKLKNIHPSIDLPNRNPITGFMRAANVCFIVVKLTSLSVKKCPIKHNEEISKSSPVFSLITTTSSPSSSTDNLAMSFAICLESSAAN